MAQGFWILSMFNHDPMYGDNTTCDCCGDVFDVRNSPHEVVGDNWVCGSCVEYYDDEELRERLLSAGFWSAVRQNLSAN